MRQAGFRRSQNLTGNFGLEIKTWQLNFLWDEYVAAEDFKQSGKYCEYISPIVGHRYNYVLLISVKQTTRVVVQKFIQIPNACLI